MLIGNRCFRKILILVFYYTIDLHYQEHIYYHSLIRMYLQELDNAQIKRKVNSINNETSHKYRARNMPIY